MNTLQIFLESLCASCCCRISNIYQKATKPNPCKRQPSLPRSKTLRQQRLSGESVRVQLTNVSFSRTQIFHCIYHSHNVKLLKQNCASLQREIQKQRGKKKKTFTPPSHILHLNKDLQYFKLIRQQNCVYHEEVEQTKQHIHTQLLHSNPNTGMCLTIWTMDKQSTIKKTH